MASPDTEVFVHVRIVLGMVVSLGLARLLLGSARLVQHPGQVKPYWVHLAWAFSLLLTLIHFWWWEFRLSTIGTWHFTLYFFIIVYAALIFLLCALLFPDSMAEYSGYKEYFYSRRGWFFGVLAVSYLIDLFDTLVKGREYYASLGPVYPWHIGLGIVLSITAGVTRSERFHAAFVIASIVYQIAFITGDYATLR